MILFQGPVGRVIALPDPAIQGDARFISVDDAPILYNSQRSIITRLVLNQQVNVQFLHTLGAFVFIYVFGDRMGTVGLSGLSFANIDAGGGCTAGGPHGAELMLAWYKENRASRRPNPVRILIGNTAIEGFVVGFSEDTVDAASQLVQWGVDLRVLPEDEVHGQAADAFNPANPLGLDFAPPPDDPTLPDSGDQNTNALGVPSGSVESNILQGVQF